MTQEGVIMKKYIKAIRAQDIQNGLLSINSGLANFHMKNIKLIGATSQICSLISPFQVVDGYDSLIIAAGEMGIDEYLLEKSLEELEEIEFIRIIKNGSSIKKIEISIPELKNRYEIIGEKLENTKITEIEQVALNILDDLVEIPMKSLDVIEKYNISNQDFSIIKDIGNGAGFLNFYLSPVSSEEIWYAPIYWEENPKLLMELCDRYNTNEVLKAVKSLRSNQGKPIEMVTDPILLEAISSGCLPAPEVSSTAGEKKFLFTPLQGVKKYEKSILNKARAIVACMRYGEAYGQITKIKYPKLFLESFLQKGYIRPHTEVPTQYSILTKLSVGVPDRVHGTSRYSFRLLDTFENRRALELAIQMVDLGIVNKSYEEEEAAKDIMLAGTYQNPNHVRINIKKSMRYSMDNVILINEIIRGVSSELTI